MSRCRSLSHIALLPLFPFSVLPSQPVLRAQAGHSRKLTGVMRYQRNPAQARMRRDEQVVAPNGQMSRQAVVATKAAPQTFAHLLKIAYFGALLRSTAQGGVKWPFALAMVVLAEYARGNDAVAKGARRNDE